MKKIKVIAFIFFVLGFFITLAGVLDKPDYWRFPGVLIAGLSVVVLMISGPKRKVS